MELKDWAKNKKNIILKEEYLNDEDLSSDEKEKILKEIFHSKIRETQLEALRNNVGIILRKRSPTNLNLIGAPGTGKTITTLYFLSQVKKVSSEIGIDFEYFYIDANNFNSYYTILNEIAIQIGAMERHVRAYPTADLLRSIFDKLEKFKGYIIFFIDEIDKVKSGLNDLVLALCKTFNQKTKAKIGVIFLTNKVDWDKFLESNVKSVMKMPKVLFNTYNAFELQKILKIRVKKALDENKVDEGVIEKIAAYSSRESGDARKAVELLIKACHIAENNAGYVKIRYVDEAEEMLEREKTIEAISTLATQQKLVLLSCYQIEGSKPIFTGDIYEKYRENCGSTGNKVLTQRRVIDFLSELDSYGLINTRIISKGRYGRTTEISHSISGNIIDEFKDKLRRSLDL